MENITENLIRKMDEYFRAANYISASQLYLLDNPLLREPLKKEHIKSKIVGHWGTVPGQNFVYTHLNRAINKYDLDMLLVSGPGHGGNFMIANTYIEGSYTEKYPNITEDEKGLKELFRQFSFPGGVPSHVAPETPGSINEGGELGYSLAHAYGSVLDNPDLITACIVGDGEAETGPLATSWHLNKFINPKKDGTVLPILHLNGYKISNPTMFSRISKDEINKFFEGCGYKPYFVEGSNTMDMHYKMAYTLEEIIKEIKLIREDVRINKNTSRHKTPMIILRTPKGWTGPKKVHNKQIEGTFRAHQVPISMEKTEDINLLESWLKSYKPDELFTIDGKIKKEIKQLCPKGNKRMGSNPKANGGLLLKDLNVPDFRKYALDIKKHGQIDNSDMTSLGEFIRDVIKNNKDNFMLFGPDETMSNKLTHVFETTNRVWNAEKFSDDEYLSNDGRVMDGYLSEHICEGLLEGYLLTGRHGVFASYEAFIRVIDSMTSQHAKWLKVCKEISWRRDIASLNYILSSNVWQQDHNGFTHQDPGFIDHVANKKADTSRIYLPPDTNCLLSVFNHCIKTKNYINVIISSKHLRPQWLTMDEAIKHTSAGVSIWKWASNDEEKEPDVVLVSAGDTPTLEALAATSIIRKHLNIKIRFINVVDLMKLQSNNRHPHGLTDNEYDGLFTKDKPIIFVYHGYPSLIREFLYDRNNRNLEVLGYNEEGTITTAFDMRVKNEIDRYHIVMKIIDKLPKLGTKGIYLKQLMKEKLIEHSEYIKKYGIDMEEIRNWKWDNE